MQQTHTPQQRQIRIDREHANDVQKIEVRMHDVTELETSIEIDTRIINKLKRKLNR